MTRGAALLVAGVALAACTVSYERTALAPLPPVDGARLLVVDDRFDEGERAAITRSVFAWQAVCPALHLRVVTPTEAWAWPEPYALRIENTRDAAGDCYDPGAPIAGCWLAPDRIILEGERLPTFPALATHELGHAFGLPDRNEGRSVMRSVIQQAAPSPTPEDARALQAVYPCERP